MSDRYYASIEVRGGITEEQFKELMGYIDENDVGGEEGPESKEDLLEAVMHKKLFWADSEAVDGFFPDFESFLQTVKIPYIRLSSAHYENQAVRSVYNGRRERSFACDNNGKPYLHLSEVYKLRTHRRFNQWIKKYYAATMLDNFHITDAKTPAQKKKRQAVRA